MILVHPGRTLKILTRIFKGFDKEFCKIHWDTGKDLQGPYQDLAMPSKVFVQIVQFLITCIMFLGHTTGFLIRSPDFRGLALILSVLTKDCSTSQTKKCYL